MNTLKDYRARINEAIDHAIYAEDNDFNLLYESMRYSLDAGGKRIRPVLMQLAYEAIGGKEEITSYLVAIEMIHTYSLIHDDLPAMDNDELRRGKPTNHIVYGEATAILAGDALLTYAFERMLKDATQKGGIERVKAAYLLSKASGMHGMVGGQILDMQSENKAISKEMLDKIHANKTGALIAVATQMGAVLAGASQKEEEALYQYGIYIGKVFQIIDDVLDMIATKEEMGKSVGSDEKNQKNTSLSFYSIEECYKIANTLTQKALSCLDVIQGETTLLRQIAQDLVKRRN